MAGRVLRSHTACSTRVFCAGRCKEGGAVPLHKSLVFSEPMEVDFVIQQLFELPKFEAQKAYCQSLMPHPRLREIFCRIIDRWDEIPTNRRDKFLYFVMIALPRVDYDVTTIQDTDLRNYCMKNSFALNENMIRYVAVCRHKSTLSVIRERVSVVSPELKSLALALGKKKETGQANREILYEIYKFGSQK